MKVCVSLKVYWVCECEGKCLSVWKCVIVSVCMCMRVCVFTSILGCVCVQTHPEAMSARDCAMAMRCRAGRLSPARLERGGSGAAHADDTGPSTRAEGVGAQLVVVEISACPPPLTPPPPPPPPVAVDDDVLMMPVPDAPLTVVVGVETGGRGGTPDEVGVETEGGGGGGMGGGGGLENVDEEEEEEEGSMEEEAGTEESESPAVAAPSRERE